MTGSLSIKAMWKGLDVALRELREHIPPPTDPSFNDYAHAVRVVEDVYICLRQHDRSPESALRRGPAVTSAEYLTAASRFTDG